MMVGTAVSMLGLVLISLFPEFAISHNGNDAGAWQGIFIDRTSAAKCLVFLLSPALAAKGRPFGHARLSYIALLMLLIVKAHAATSIVVLATFGIAMFLRSCLRKLDLPLALIACCFMIITAIALSITIGDSLLPSILGFLGKDTTLTGRTEIWDVVTTSILKRPLLGYGFYAFWLGFKGESGNVLQATNWMFGYAHNGILEIFLQLGLAGVVIFLTTFLQAVRNAWICVRNGVATEVEWYIGLIILTVLYNLDESTVVWPNELLSILYVVACCGLAKAARESRRDTMLGTVQ
jgi:O-antigen ligase